MKKLSLILAITILAVAVLAPAAFAVKNIMYIENGRSSGSATITQTADGLKVCSSVTPTLCLMFSPASSSGTTTVLPPLSVSASATGLTSSITDTATGAALTSGPTLTITQPGTWAVVSTVTTSFAALQTSTVSNVTCKLYRTNNTPGEVTGSSGLVSIPTTSDALSGTGLTISTPVTLYTTTRSDDTLQVYCGLNANPTGGAIQATTVYMHATRYQ